MKKVFVAVPCMDMVSAQFAASLAQLQVNTECKIGFQIGSLIYDARNRLAVKAIEAGADYTMWFDSDMVFPTDTLTYMVDQLEKNDYDILSGLYFRRQPPFTPVLFDELNMTEDGCQWTEFEEIPETPFEIGGCGFGCVLMKTDIFIDVYNKYGNPFTPMLGVGEDLSFCWRAREMGFKIWCDPKILCGHVGYQLITKQYYDLLKEKTKDA